MKETENTRLLRLYKLLWEQIKDKEIMGLYTQSTALWYNQIITNEEKNILDDHILSEKEKLRSFLDNKAFVQRMIKELENQN